MNSIPNPAVINNADRVLKNATQSANDNVSLNGVAAIPVRGPVMPEGIIPTNMVMQVPQQAIFPIPTLMPASPPAPTVPIQPPITPPTLNPDAKAQLSGNYILPELVFHQLKQSLHNLTGQQMRALVQHLKLPFSGNRNQTLHQLLTFLDRTRLTDLPRQVLIEVNQHLEKPKPEKHHGMQQFVPKPMLYISPAPELPDNTPLLKFGDKCLVVLKMDKPGECKGVFHFQNDLPGAQLCLVPIPADPFAVYSFKVEINGNQFVKLIDDTDPQPLDVTKAVIGGQNALKVIEMHSNSRLKLIICQYALFSLPELLQHYYGAPDVSSVRGSACAHEEGFPAIDFLFSVLYGRPAVCPICNAPVSFDTVILVG